MTDTETRLLAVLRGHLGLESEVDTAISELDLDSLDWIELLMATEDEFDVSITDDEAESFAGQTVRDWALFVDGKR